jgi:hypothetical protein
MMIAAGLLDSVLPVLRLLSVVRCQYRLFAYGLLLEHGLLLPHGSSPSESHCVRLWSCVRSKTSRRGRHVLGLARCELGSVGTGRRKYFEGAGRLDRLEGWDAAESSYIYLTRSMPVCMIAWYVPCVFPIRSHIMSLFKALRLVRTSFSLRVAQ